MAPLKTLTEYLAQHGRNGDTQLVHMSKSEVAALHGIASLAGRKLSKNPHTGAVEAFDLWDILLPVAGIGAAIFAPELLGLAGLEGAGAATGAAVGADALAGGAAALAAPTAAAGSALAGGASGLAAAAPVLANAAPAMAMANAAPAAAGIGDALATGAQGIAAQAPQSFMSQVGDFAGAAIKPANLPYTMMGLGALNSMMTPTSSGPGKKKYKDVPMTQPIQRSYNAPPSDFVAGYDPEWQYFTPTPRVGHLAAGGPVQGQQPNGLQMLMANMPGNAGGSKMARKGHIGDGGAQTQVPQQYSAPFQYTPRPPGGTQEGNVVMPQPSMTPALFNPVRPAGVAGMAAGGLAYGPYQHLMAGGGRVPGTAPGQADTVNAVIDGSQPAALSSGEFVMPADVVSHLGDGNTDAGADQLHQLIHKIRMLKTGSPGQPKKIA